MPPPRHCEKSPFARARGGFSLIELIVVMSIVSIMAVLCLMSVQGVLGGVNLRGSGNTVVAELNLARQTAITRNLPVDFRVYQVADASGVSVYRAISLVISSASSGAAADEYIGKPVVLPSGIIIVADTTYSSLLNPAASATRSPTSGTETLAAPQQVKGCAYVKFAFLPSGALNLDSSVAWCLTLTNQHFKAGATGAPAANYVAIVLDSQTGRPSVFQP